MPLNERILVQELRQGNTKAFEELYLLYHARLYHFCLKTIRNAQEAEDLVQEVFMAIWENRENLDEDKSFGGFIFRIVRNKLLNRIKQNLSRQVYLEYVLKENQDQHDLRKEIEAREFIDLLSKMIQTLPERTKEVFLLSRNEGLTYQEIAQRLDISENVVDHEIRKALKLIREKVKNHYSS